MTFGELLDVGRGMARARGIDVDAKGPGWRFFFYSGLCAGFFFGAIRRALTPADRD